jgi:hypothetical protein
VSKSLWYSPSGPGHIGFLRNKLCKQTLSALKAYQLLLSITQLLIQTYNKQEQLLAHTALTGASGALNSHEYSTAATQACTTVPYRIKAFMVLQQAKQHAAV